MHIDDPYSELGLDPGCSDAELKAAWRRLAARWHPDRNDSPQALRRIQRINLALEQIRALRSEPACEAESQAESQAGAPSARPDPAPHEDPALVHELSLTLEEAACGCVRTIEGQVQSGCAACGGSGQQAEPVPCASCGGEGRVANLLWFGWGSPWTPCKDCAGEGAVHVACGECGGSGRAPLRRYRGQVRIPPGVREGDLLSATVPLKGGKGGPSRLPLSVRVALAPHAFFALAADGTVRLEVPVDGFAWMASRWVEVPTPHGPQQMRLQRGALAYRIRERGLAPAAGERPADCLVTVVPLFPETLSAAQEALVDALVAANSGDPASPAGERMQAWQATLSAWQAR